MSAQPTDTSYRHHPTLARRQSELSSVLPDTRQATLLHWTSYLSPLTSKQVDSMLTKAYSSISKSCKEDNAEISPLNIFALRAYALKCLLHTSPGILQDASKFWVEVLNVVSTLNGSKVDTDTGDDVKRTAILNVITELVSLVEKRSDAEEFFATSKSWMRVVEGWSNVAKEANDTNALNRINEILQGCGSSTSPSVTADPSSNESSTTLASSPHAQESTALTRINEVDSARLCTHVDAINRTQPFLAPQTPNEASRICDKVYRAVERIRRASVPIYPPNEPLKSTLLVSICDVLEKVLQVVVPSQSEIDASQIERLRSSLLDKLFCLVRTRFPCDSEPVLSGYDASFAYLERAMRCLGYSASTSPAFGTSLRCPDQAKHATNPSHIRTLSDAFYNTAGTLYKAGQFSLAVRFLERACLLGEEALRLYRERASPTSASAKGKGKAKADTWKTFKETMWKRWEGLGVSHAKTGDRKLAYDAFVKAISSFPYTSPAYADVFRNTLPVSLIFDSPSITSSPIGQLMTLLDRITYMGSSELFLDPSQVSLKAHIPPPTDVHAGDREMEVWSCFVGALLERQVATLESSRYKPAVQTLVGVLLNDALGVYTAEDQIMRIRRAGLLVQLLEHQYFIPQTSSKEQSVQDIAGQIEELLSHELTPDSPLIPLTIQYRASSHLWLALHTHRTNDRSKFPNIITYTEQTCKLIKSYLSSDKPRTSGVPRFSLGKGRPSLEKSQMQKTPPAGTTTRKSRLPTAASGRRLATASRGARTAKVVEPVTPKSNTAAVADVPPLGMNTPADAKTLGAGQGNVGLAMALDNFEKFLDLLRIAADLFALLGHSITRVHVLVVIRRLCERNMTEELDEYVQAAINLAHEYVKLGKMQRAGNLYAHLLNAVRNPGVTNETRILYYLRYAELLGATGNILKGSSIYCEAHAAAEKSLDDDKGTTTSQKVKAKVSLLERAAVAASTFAVIQYSKDDPNASLNGLLQALRLYNRAIETLTRLAPPPPSSKPDDKSDNPFDMSDVKAALPAEEPSKPTPLDQPTRKTFPQRSSLSSLELRVASGLLSTLFSLSQAYFARGSAREAEYFATQAHDLAESLNAPAMISRSLSRLGELKLRMGKAEEAHDCLMKAAELLNGIGGIDAVDVHRLKGEVLIKLRMESGVENVDNARVMYEEAMRMLEELDDHFSALDSGQGPRQSLRASVSSSQPSKDESLAPSLLIAVLRQNISLLHKAGEEYNDLLAKLQSLSSTAENKAVENALLAKLTLDDAYARFRADMFLSSLAESGGRFSHSPATQEILATLDAAEKLFWSDLQLVARRGTVSHVRDSVVSLALIRAFQTSLGKTGEEGPMLAASLLDSSAAITLRREILEAIQHKFPGAWQDDLQWPRLTTNGSVLPPAPPKRRTRFLTPDSDVEDDEAYTDPESTESYWKQIAAKYSGQLYDPSVLSNSQIDALPAHWTVASITLSSDQKTIFITRQRPKREPLIFCVPLGGRREADNEEEDKLSYGDAVNELREIVRLSDEGTRNAANVKRDDKDARAQWWAARSDLDKRLKTFLENLEFCWLGAFKTVLSKSLNVSEEQLHAFRTKLEKIFKRTLLMPTQPEKKQAKNSRIHLSDSLLECLGSLPPTCDSEELEDFAYFILDLYQFHGVPVATSEVDMDHLVIDLRAALEEFVASTKPVYVDHETDDEHLFLVVDKNLQGIPWESIPILRGRSVSRIPSLDFLLDRVAYAKWQRKVGAEQDGSSIDRVTLNPRNTFFILNPSGDLKNTEGRFAPWLKDMKKQAGWDGIIGRQPSEQEFLNGLSRHDLMIYFGHGGAEQYVRSHKIRHLPRCAATMLWGCSSGALKEMGDFDRVGTPYHYMLAGCPTLVANLWDVTDRDIDKFSQSVFDKLRLTSEHVNRPSEPGKSTSVVQAVAQSRDACKLRYLTGAAPVVYGIPFYL
ncbi:hypothetical protein K474DRAFT_1599575 [Panus rudis PR-1116 ss-1]|nr:hypothetical protein K474DRAFT_1599575 [Panus rudis PR-1116 ss-1]